MKITFIWHETNIDEKQKEKIINDIKYEVNAQVKSRLKNVPNEITIDFFGSPFASTLKGVASTKNEDEIFTVTYSLQPGNDSSYNFPENKIK